MLIMPTRGPDAKFLLWSIRWLFHLSAYCSICLAASTDADRTLAMEVFRELININTTDSIGDNTKAAEAMAVRLRSAGFSGNDVQVLVESPRKGNLVARLHGTGAGKPILFLGHLDVVEARKEDWSFDPFQFREESGYFYGRGTQDMKADDALLVTAFMKLKQEGFQPKRDLILALTSDEEGGDHNGVEWLLKSHRDLIDAEFCINADGGGGELSHGKRLAMTVEAGEKAYVTYHLETKNKGGHSSLPEADNAIYELAAGLEKLSQYKFPVHLNDVNRGYFERMANVETGQTAADFRTIAANPQDAGALTRLSAVPLFNAYLRTTCIATQLEAGHAENALPQHATAVVNCRLLPGDTKQDVAASLGRVVGDPRIQVSVSKSDVVSPLSSPRPDVMKAFESVTDSTLR